MLYLAVIPHHLHHHHHHHGIPGTGGLGLGLALLCLLGFLAYRILTFKKQG